MQNTELDPTLSATLEKVGKNAITLVIGNKNYSSWSDASVGRADGFRHPVS